MDLHRVDGVAHIVALAVGNVGDEVLWLTQLLADELHDVDVAHLVVPADVVDLAHAAPAASFIVTAMRHHLQAVQHL